MSTPHEPCGRRERIAQRRDQVFALRVSGKSNRVIARELSCGETTVRTDLRRVLSVLAARTLDNAAELRALEVARLDVGIESIAADVKKGEPRALDLWLRYSESRRRLLGLDLSQGNAAALLTTGGGSLTFNIIRDDSPGVIAVESHVIEPDDGKGLPKLADLNPPRVIPALPEPSAEASGNLPEPSDPVPVEPDRYVESADLSTWGQRR